MSSNSERPRSAVDMGRISWTEFAEFVRSDRPVVFLPIGALEQHGPHLPLATDALIPTAVCRDVARNVGGLVAPAITYGYKSVPRCGGGQHFPGTISLDAANFINQLKDVIRELVDDGAANLALVIGHMENQWFVTEACDLALRDIRMLSLPMPRIMTVGYWEYLSPETIDKAFEGEFPNWALEHAGIMETSVMLHLHPDLVHMERLTPHPPADLPAYDLWPYDAKRVPETGILNTARGATAEKGRLFYEEYVRSLTAAVREAFGQSQAPIR